MRAIIVMVAAASLAAGGAAAQGDREQVADPLGGAWMPVRIGTVAVPAAAEARLFFSGGSEFSTQAGCGNFGGFYSLEGSRLRVRPRDPIDTRKCLNRAAARLETLLAGFVAQAATFDLRPDGALRIVSGDGRIGLFRRPPHAVPALAGPWLVESIGRDPVPYARRAQLNFRDQWVSAAADCNRYSARIRPAGTGFTVTGGAATEMGCDPDRQAFDTRLFTAVAGARRWTKLPNGQIRLEGGADPLLLIRPPTLR